PRVPSFPTRRSSDLSLRGSMTERMRQASPLTRWFWRAESRRVVRAESGAASAYDRVVAVSSADAAELGGEAIANGVVVTPLHGRSEEHTSELQSPDH